MHLTWKSLDNAVLFIAEDIPTHYQDALQALAFAKTDDGMARFFPKDTPYLEMAFAHFQRSFETMLQQAAHEIPVAWEAAFEGLLQRIQSLGTDWWVTGSLAYALRGLPIEPGDLDFIVEGDGALQWREALVDLLIEPTYETSWFCKYWGRAFHHARIEWVGAIDPTSDFSYVQDFYLPVRDHLETVTWRGYSVRIPPLEPMLKLEEMRGRLDRVQLIREALQKA
ncbi:MAG: hypothetical protein BroJett018_32880 [Chloroflexota bacterium]|nr:MAG: hypothetical protein BroJett018_32880 [Chloroflexota bacterium]